MHRVTLPFYEPPAARGKEKDIIIFDVQVYSTLERHW